MKCSELEHWLSENPGKEPDGGIARHIGLCRDCRRIWEEQRGLELSLRALPAAEPPPFFETRLKAGLAGDSSRPSLSWRPALAPLAAFSAVVLAAGYLALSYFPRMQPMAVAPSVAPAPAPPPAPAPAVAAVPQAEPTAIYPVWPGDEDAVPSDDLSIMACLYPAPESGSVVSMSLDDVDVSGTLSVEGELISFIPKSAVAPGRHVVTISLKDASGARRSVSYTFFALEVPS